MLNRLRRPSPPLVISLIAVFVALGGSAYAVKLGKNTVGPKQLKNKAVGTKELKNKAVGTKQLKGNAAGTDQLKDDSVNGAKVVNGSLSAVDIDQSSLTSVPNTVTPFGARLAPNQSETAVVKGVLFTQTANGAGDCTQPTFSPPEGGYGQDGDYFSFSTQVAVGAGGTYTATILQPGNIGEMAFIPSDGTGGVKFHLGLRNDGGLCLVSGYGVGAG